MSSPTKTSVAKILAVQPRDVTIFPDGSGEVWHVRGEFSLAQLQALQDHVCMPVQVNLSGPYGAIEWHGAIEQVAADLDLVQSLLDRGDATSVALAVCTCRHLARTYSVKHHRRLLKVFAAIAPHLDHALQLDALLTIEDCRAAAQELMQ